MEYSLFIGNKMLSRRSAKVEYIGLFMSFTKEYKQKKRFNKCARNRTM